MLFCNISYGKCLIGYANWRTNAAILYTDVAVWSMY